MIPALNPNIAKTTNQVKNNPFGSQFEKKFNVNITNNKLNANTTTAKGLEKVIGVIAKFIIKAQGKTNKIFYGEFKLKQNQGTAIQRALDKGIDNLLTNFAGVDFCNLLNYTITQVPKGQSFNPRGPIPTDKISRAKWNLQNKAFEVQKKIDKYYTSYGDASNPESKLGLSNLIRDINEIFSTILSPNTGVNDPELIQAFPQLSVAGNFLSNSSGIFNSYTNVSNIPNTDVKKIVNTIDKVRYYCIAIQGLNSVASAVNFVDTILDSKVQQEIAKINKLVPLKDISKVIKSILRLANNINSVAQNALKYINTARTIIRLVIFILKAFTIVKTFIVAIPIPSLFGTKGTDIKLNDIFQQKLTELGQKKLVKRLNQINAVLNLMTIFVTSLVAIMGEIIGKLNAVLLNIENCNIENSDLIDAEIKQDLTNTITSLTITANALQDFLDKTNQTDDNKNKIFGEYTIEIVSEELVDEGISIRRRYGIARNNSGYIVVESTPTFASLDLIIINEVKVLLVSKGLVKANLEGLSSEEEVTVIESLSYLEDDNITIDNINVSEQDIQNYKDQDDELGLSSFINNLPGGTSLRKKVRSLLSKQSQKLKSNLSSTDPEGKYSNSISGVTDVTSGIVGSGPDPNQLEIDKLQKEKSRLQATLPVAASNPILLAITIKKIKEVDNKIKQLKNG